MGPLRYCNKILRQIIVFSHSFIRRPTQFYKPLIYVYFVLCNFMFYLVVGLYFVMDECLLQCYIQLLVTKAIYWLTKMTSCICIG